MVDRRPRGGTVLAELWRASDEELRAPGVAMPYFRRWQAAVTEGRVECTLGAALVALRLDLGCSASESPNWDVLQPWVERLQAVHDAN